MKTASRVKKRAQKLETETWGNGVHRTPQKQTRKRVRRIQEKINQKTCRYGVATGSGDDLRIQPIQNGEKNDINTEIGYDVGMFQTTDITNGQNIDYGLNTSIERSRGHGVWSNKYGDVPPWSPIPIIYTPCVLPLWNTYFAFQCSPCIRRDCKKSRQSLA